MKQASPWARLHRSFVVIRNRSGIEALTPVHQEQAEIPAVDDTVPIQVRITWITQTLTPQGEHDAEIRSADFSVTIQVSRTDAQEIARYINEGTVDLVRLVAADRTVRDANRCIPRASIDAGPSGITGHQIGGDRATDHLHRIGIVIGEPEDRASITPAFVQNEHATGQTRRSQNDLDAGTFSDREIVVENAVDVLDITDEGQSSTPITGCVVVEEQTVANFTAPEEVVDARTESGLVVGEDAVLDERAGLIHEDASTHQT